MDSTGKAGEDEKILFREWIPSRLQIRQYAEASGDFNPIHLDDRYAHEAGLGGVIAHGMLTMAQCAAMVTDWASDKGDVARISVRFEGMVRPGERVNFVGYVRRRKSNELECQITALKGAEEKVLSGSVIIRCKSACKDFEE